MKINAKDYLLLFISACGNGEDKVKYALYQGTEYLRKKKLIVNSTPVFPEYSGEKEYKLTEKAMKRLSRAFGIRFVEE